MGKYTYTVTPRYFDDNQSLLPLDQDLSISVDANVLPFQKSQLQLAFTRGFTQLQAFVHHFGLKAPISPKGDKVRFDTSQQAGQNAAGERFTFLDEYEWLGYTARERLFGLINEVISNRSLHLDMFAYDLSEPDFIALLLQLAGQGRIRLILDNAALHHSTTKPTAEDEFEQLLNQVAKGNSAILRGKFGRYAHDKVLIVSDSQGAKRILTGSTNFSITGLYVNSNHVLIFDDPAVAQKIPGCVQSCLGKQSQQDKLWHSPLAAEPFSFSGQATPRTDISFAPHTPEVATNILQALADRIEQEGQQNRGKGSVLFAVMEMDQGRAPFSRCSTNSTVSNPSSAMAFPMGRKALASTNQALRPVCWLRESRNTRSFRRLLTRCLTLAASDTRSTTNSWFAAFNGSNPVVYCGSSNLAIGGEDFNGDNLLAIYDTDVATAFAVEALALVDHSRISRTAIVRESQQKIAGNRQPI